MSNRNKSFRSHCNIDVLLDKEGNTVSVEVAYKPELLETPLCWQSHRYYCHDVVEELERQGLYVEKATVGFGEELNNITVGSRNPYIEASYVFPLANGTDSKDPAPPPEASAPPPESKKIRPRSKSKTNK